MFGARLLSHPLLSPGRAHKQRHLLGEEAAVCESIYAGSIQDRGTELSLPRYEQHRVFPELVRSECPREPALTGDPRGFPVSRYQVSSQGIEAHKIIFKRRGRPLRCTTPLRAIALQRRAENHPLVQKLHWNDGFKITRLSGSFAA